MCPRLRIGNPVCLARFSRDWVSESSRQERTVCQELEIQSCDIPHLAQNERDVGHPRSVASTKGSVVVWPRKGPKAQLYVSLCPGDFLTR
jgi:hypothetical protein